jgi:FMN phosphatase YigB (HAD superfamily)
MTSDLEQLMSGIRVVSWDVDGTLFSYWKVVAPMVCEVMGAGAAQGWGYVARQVDQVWQFHRTVEQQRRRRDSAVHTASLERFSDAVRWEREMLDRALVTIRPRRRATALMDHLAAAGVAQVALSDFECASKAQRLRLGHYFVQTYSCESLGFWKPSPVPLARIQQDFGITADEHLHIGDRLDADGAACAANGCRFLPIGRVPRAWNVFNAICAASAPE